MGFLGKLFGKKDEEAAVELSSAVTQQPVYEEKLQTIDMSKHNENLGKVLIDMSTLRYGKLNVEELHERCQADIKTAGLPCQKTLAITHMNECGKIALSVRDTFKDDWEVKYFYFEVN